MSQKQLSLSNKFELGFIINSSFMLFEFAVGFITGSLILIADASHNLTDSITLAISWLGNRIAKKPADTSHTLGHGRAAVLTAFINSTILVAVAVLIFFEAYQRFLHPVSLKGGVIAATAVVGIFANGSIALLFRKSTSDINVRAAYTNMAFDTIFSVAAMVAGLLILLTHKTWIDPAISVGVGLGLLYAAFGILRQATNIFLEGVPYGLDLPEIRNVILAHDGVKAISDLYVWAISSDEHALCCTIVPENTEYKQLKAISQTLERQLKKLGFQIVVIQVT